MKKKSGSFKSLLLSFALITGLFSLQPVNINAEEEETDRLEEIITEPGSEQDELTENTVHEQTEAPLPDAGINASERASGTSGTVKWVLDYDGLLTISPVSGNSGTFASFSEEPDGAPWYNVRDYIKKVIFKGTIYGAENMAYMFYRCESMTSIDVTGFDTSHVKNMYSMFGECFSLTTLDLRGFDTRNVEDMYWMFVACTSLTSVDVSSFDTENVLYMNGLFNCCSSLTHVDISNFDTRNVVNVYAMFAGCHSLTSIDFGQFETGFIVNMGHMFEDCYSLTSLDLSNFDTRNVEEMRCMFHNCRSLTNLDLSGFVTSSVTRMDDLFNGCSNLKNLNLKYFNTVNVESMNNMFRDCSALNYLDLSYFDAGRVTDTEGMLSGCSMLNELESPEKIGTQPIALPHTMYYQSGASWIPVSELTSALSGTKHFVRNNTGNPVVEFVTRLYNVCLGRNPDTGGLNTWVNKLTSRQTTGIQAAYGFIFSTEFKNKNYCNEHYVEQLYLAFMGRPADSGGKANWVKKLVSGVTREEVFNGFALSKEFNKLCGQYGITRGGAVAVPRYGTVPRGKCSICGRDDDVTMFVKRMYRVCLGREADAGGLKTWTTALWEHTKSGRQIGEGFIFSKEFTNRNYDDSDYIEHLYEAFMGRASDEGGKANWLEQLANGKTRRQVFNGFAGSAEFDLICRAYGIVRG